MNVTRLGKNFLLILLTVIVTLWTVRALQSRSMPDIQAWHSAALEAEFRARDYPEGIRFLDYLKLEERLADRLDNFTRSRIPESRKPLGMRYQPRHPLNPRTYDTDWNWSSVTQTPNARGSAVLIHGASDSPYSMRTLAKHMAQENLNVVTVRLPGHGTLPGELKTARKEDWIAILTSAVAHARNLGGDEKPLYLAGYSMGGALAVNHALEALTDESLVQPDGVILLSPAIGISRFAALAQADLWMSHLPGFEQFAWTSISPEFDPYKYSSFPKQTGRETYELTRANRNLMQQLHAAGTLNEMPPILTFLSIVDATVSVDAVVEMYQQLPGPGNKLVLYGVNHTNQALGFLRPSYLDSLDAVVTDGDRPYELEYVSNRNAQSLEVLATQYCASNACMRSRALNASWPESVFSLSHVALPFAPDDPLYGSAPTAESPGNFTLGSLQPRGERGILVVPTDQLMRLRYNPFIDHLLETTSQFCRR